MRRWLLLPALLAAPALAQQEEDRDRGFLVGLIEDNLSAPGLDVRLDGFQGALSSEASLDRLAVSDEAGTWLVLEDVVLDWNRSALLRGRLEVETLTADLIRLERLPLPPEGAEALPDVGASGFSLPNLPVAVNVDRLSAARIELGEPLLGQPLALTLSAQARLVDGTGSLSLEARRIDGDEGTFAVDLAYLPEEGGLSIDLDVSEAAGGVVATLLQLPGAPAIDLSVEGAGPLNDFSAELALASDGLDRVTGRVALAGTEDGRRFDVDLGGDLSTLLAPDYRPFFGDDVGIEARGTLLDAGGVDVETLSIDTRALTLSGALRLGPDNFPSFADIDGRLEAPDGGSVTLPVASAATLDRATFSLSIDAARSDLFALDLNARGYDGPEATLDDITLALSGRLSRDGGAVSALDARLRAAASGLALADPALAEALGADLALVTDIDWQRGGPVRLSDLALDGVGLDLSGTLAIDAGDGAGLTLSPDLLVETDDLARFSALAGRDLSGAATLAATGTVAPLAGTFDLALDGRTTDLALGIAQADALLSGVTDLDLAARRTLEGTILDRLSVENPQLTLTAEAALFDAEALAGGRTGRAVLDARIADGTVLDPRLDGPVTLAADLDQSEAGIWRGELRAAAPQDVTLSASGTLTGPDPDIAFDGAVPDLSAFVDALPGGATLSGRATSSEGVWSIDAEATGPWDLSARVQGPVTGPAPTLDVSARLPELGAPIPADLPEPLRGAVMLDGQVLQREGAWRVDLAAEAPAGITLRARGPVAGAPLRLDFAGTIPEVGDLVPTLDGTLSLDGTLAREAEGYALDVTANGPAGLRATAETVLTERPLTIDFTALAPDLSALVAGVPGDLDISGTATRTGTGWAVDLAGTGPYAAILDANLALDDGTPSVTLTARIPQSGAIAPQLQGPLDLEASATLAEAGWRVDAVATGAQDLRLAVEGLATGPEASLDIDLSADEIGAFAPGLSGALQADATLFRRDDQWAADLSASGPLGATLTADATLTGPAPEATFDLRVPDVGPLLPDISGPLRLTGTAARRAEAWALDVNLDGPAGTQADVIGTVAGTTLDLDVTGSAPLGLANAVLAPRRLAGTARFDLSVNGPPALDSVSGTIATSGASLALPTLRNAIEEIDGTVQLSGGQARIDLSGALLSGGRLAVSGPVSLSAPFDADLTATIDATLQDPALYTAEVAGQVTLDGPLAGGATIGGRIVIDEAEIVVPSTGLTAIGDIPPIEHLFSPRPVRRTLARAGQLDAAEEARDGGNGGGGGPVYRLDLAIEAPGRIFVRGRGLDAELGGRLRLTGTTADPVTAGGFELIRGRLDILSQRFNLDEGALTFAGDLTPNIRLVAVTETDTLTASIIVEGPADAIDVRFTSTPEVPQEEILAQIFFGRDLSQLSPLQALQLANSVAVLAGRSQGGLLDDLRGSAGLDDLDVTTDEEGNVALRAGRYISDNVYTDVQIDQEGDAEISLNLDVTPNLTVRGTAGPDGQTSLGVFFEQDY
jgi:translocation and assembly module TamB